MAITDLKYHEITEKIIGCAIKVHKYFGPGFSEIVYKRAVLIEMDKVLLQYASEIQREIIYEGKVIAWRRLDVIVAEKILVEFKAIGELDNKCFAQVINYLRVFNLEVGLLLNFGEASLKFKRFINIPQSVKSNLNP
jgi:GxxExxY protein